jgi:hypothetical protein
MDLSRPLEKLKSLSLSLSNHIQEDTEDKLLKSLVVGKRYFSNIAWLLEKVHATQKSRFILVQPRQE